MPVSECHVATTHISGFELVVEKTKLGFGRKTATLHTCIGRKIVVGSKHWPLVRDLQRDWAIQRTDLRNSYMTDA